MEEKKGNTLEEMKQMYPRMFFNPITVPVYADGMVVESKKAILQEGDRSFISVVSNKYVPVSNLATAEQFVRIADEAGIAHLFKDTYQIRNGALNSFIIDFPDKKIVVDGKDESTLRGYLSNGFDGFSSAKIEMGFFRLWCLNGAGYFTKDTTESFRHVGEVNSKIVDSFRGYVEETFGLVQQFVEDLTQVAFPDKETVLTQIESSEWLPKKYRNQVELEWKGGEFAESLSGWGLWNAYSKIITHSITSAESKMAATRSLSKLGQRWTGDEELLAA